MIIVHIISVVVVIYLLAGLLFAVAFITKGVSRVDEGAHGSTWGFRIIIIPGTILFWPFLLRKWITVTNRKVND